MTAARRLQFGYLAWGVLAMVLLALSGCGGGGGGKKSNRAPTASFTVTPNLGQAPLNVTVNAAASSDPDGSIASYSWNFGDNGTGAGVSATHTYPNAGTFTITLTVTDNKGATGNTTRTVTATVGPPPTTVTVSGRITFERVPFSTIAEDGLDFVQTFEAPAREIEVELLPAGGGAALATTVTDQNGNYSLTAPVTADVRVRAKAQSRFAGTVARPASWDLRVLDNTNSNALYVLDGAVFNTGIANVTRNLKATTGWSGFAGYSGPRAAAPFAVLDTLYASVQFVIANGDAAVDLAPLKAFWSEDNRPSGAWNPAAGDIVTTSYQPAPSGSAPAGIYVLGDANVDTDEFDQHVLAHEFQHYLEDTASRTDTVGGEHSLSERLDMRVAFSEGFSNAFSAMVLGDPAYRDSFGDAQGSDSGFDMESDEFGTPGWFSESSVQRIAWDLFDAANDGADGDSVSFGFGPMFDVMTTQLREGTPLTSLFSFVTALKQHAVVAPQVAAVNTRVASEGNIVAATMDAYATTETNSGVDPTDEEIVLPVYEDIAVGGSAVRLCADATFGTYNKLGNRRFLRFNVPSTDTITVRVACPVSDATCAGSPTPDPDFILSRGPTLWFGDSADPRLEELVVNVAAGDHVLEVYEYSHVAPDGTPQRGRTCMTVTIN